MITESGFPTSYVCVDIRGTSAFSYPQTQSQQPEKWLKYSLRTFRLLQLMHKSFDPIHTEFCVDVPESHDEEFNEGGRGVPSDNQLHTEYNNSTWKVFFPRDDQSTAAWKKASRKGSGSISENNLIVSGKRFLIYDVPFRALRQLCPCTCQLIRCCAC